MAVLGAIPEEPAVLQRRLGQAPLLISHPDCAATRAIRAILDALANTTNGFRPREIAPEATLAQRMQRNKRPRWHLSRSTACERFAAPC